MEEIRPFETSVLTRATRRNIQEDAILHRNRRENLRSYIGTTLAVTSNCSMLRRYTHYMSILLTRVSICVFLRSVLELLVTANVVPSSLILLTLMMEAIRSFETLVLTRATRRHIPEDDILQSSP
jgi:hypothetical protein